MQTKVTVYNYDKELIPLQNINAGQVLEVVIEEGIIFVPGMLVVASNYADPNTYAYFADENTLKKAAEDLLKISDEKDGFCRDGYLVKVHSLEKTSVEVTVANALRDLILAEQRARKQTDFQWRQISGLFRKSQTQGE